MNKSLCLAAAALLIAAGPVAADSKAHQHGAANVNIVLEENTLTIDLEMPLDSLLGFERAPRTGAERKAAAAALEKIRAGGLLFKPAPDARCTLFGTEVDADVLEPHTKHDEHAKHDGHDHHGHEHADLYASYRFQCTQPARLAALDVMLFDAFKRVQRIEVQAALPQGQSKTVLRRPATQVRLGR